MKAFVLPKLTNESFLSVGQFCDNNCSVCFHETNCNVICDNQIILTGTRNFNDKLYDVNLGPESQNKTSVQPKINYII